MTVGAGLPAGLTRQGDISPAARQYWRPPRPGGSSAGPFSYRLSTAQALTPGAP